MSTFAKKLVSGITVLLLLLSLAACGGGETPAKKGREAYFGYWQYDSGMVLQIQGDSWTLYKTTGDMMYGGVAAYEEGSMWLRDYESTDPGRQLYFENGILMEEGSPFVSLGTEDPFAAPSAQDALTGLWNHSDEEFYILFENGEYAWQQEETIVTGAYEFDGENVILYAEESYAEARLDAESDQLFVQGDAGSYYYRAEMG